MKWYIEGNRLACDTGEKTIYPSAGEIFSLNTGLHDGRQGRMDTAPEDALEIRFSRLGGRIRLVLDFDSTEGSVRLTVLAVRGNRESEIVFRDGDLQDSVVLEKTWYGLLSNHEDTLRVLESADIRNAGSISLIQYISLIKAAAHCENIDLADHAESELAGHPVNRQSGRIPVSMKAELYPYQQQGFQWMSFIAKEQCGCILGDEMGLGKTLQAITLIAERAKAGYGISLVIAPVSLLENWRREFDRFTCGLNVIVHHGRKRTGMYTELLGYDVVIISYNTACSDLSLLKMVDWDLVIVDEAQNIKNPAANRTRSVKGIPRHAAVAITGTPFENHISDLWSLLDFVIPGGFGRLSDFEAEYPDDVDGARALEPILTPLMIRRKVSDVAQDLPERIDVAQVLCMTDREALAYEEVREEILRQYDGTNASLPMLQKLRMYCTHPLLLDENAPTDPVLSSGKYERLCEILEEIISLNEKAILFTSYNRMFDILLDDMPKRFGISVMAINGSTPPGDRQPIIDRFSDLSGTALLVLNPRAAGTGLNITAASRVIHYNLEWNPSLEDQASARSYRRGQTRTVFIYRLFYRDTVEEIINDRIDRKREMFGAAVVGTDGKSENSEDIIRALMISPGGAQDGV